MKIQLRDNVYFAYNRQFEYVAVIAGMFADNLDGRLCREIYGEEFISKMKKKHREFAEIVNSLYLGGFELLEFLMDYKADQFDLYEYRKYIESMPQDVFVRQIFGYFATIEETRKALEDDEFLSQLMDERKFPINSFVNLKRIINKREEYLDMYFAAIEDIKTPELEEYLDRFEKLIPKFQKDIEEQLNIMDPMDIVEKFLSRQFCVEDGFDYHGFIPICMLPRNTVTYYNDKRQYTLYSEQRILGRQKALSILKVLADDNRIKIIDIISEEGDANGKTIARKLHLAPSTVSHHMEQLIDCGIVKEQKSGNSKVYSVDYEAGENFVKEIEAVVLKNKEYK